MLPGWGWRLLGARAESIPLDEASWTDLSSVLQVGMIGEGEEWLLIYQLSNEPDARSMEVPDLNPFTYYR